MSILEGATSTVITGGTFTAVQGTYNQKTTTTYDGSTTQQDYPGPAVAHNTYGTFNSQGSGSQPRQAGPPPAPQGHPAGYSRPQGYAGAQPRTGYPQRRSSNPYAQAQGQDANPNHAFDQAYIVEEDEPLQAQGQQGRGGNGQFVIRPWDLAVDNAVLVLNRNLALVYMWLQVLGRYLRAVGILLDGSG